MRFFLFVLFILFWYPFQVQAIITTPTPKPCLKTGCSGIICSDTPQMTTCEWREQYACYQKETCERQSDGSCGWTETDALLACLGTTSPPMPSVTASPIAPICHGVTCSPIETTNPQLKKPIQCTMTPLPSETIGNDTITYEGRCIRTTRSGVTSQFNLIPVLRGSPRFEPIQPLPGSYRCEFRHCQADVCSPWSYGPSPTPSCIPRPACLDATPRCLLPEPVDGWCREGAAY